MSSINKSCYCIFSDRYPLALVTLADLEEVSPTESRPPALNIYNQSIDCSRHHYDGSHIYPYTYLGNYYYRRANYKEALRNWAEAARVISRYALLLLTAACTPELIQCKMTFVCYRMIICLHVVSKHNELYSNRKCNISVGISVIS